MLQEIYDIRSNIMEQVLKAINLLEKKNPISKDIDLDRCHAKVTRLIWTLDENQHERLFRGMPNIKDCLDIRPFEWSKEQISNIKIDCAFALNFSSLLPA